jgi:acyl-CoA reductase-like NAD-dependent aldehyde dehydrogenase
LIRPEIYFCPGHEPNTDIGPVISQQSKERIHRLIQSAVDQGAELLLDGRNAKVRTFPKPVLWIRDVYPGSRILIFT